MMAEAGPGQAASGSGRPRPERIIERSVHAFLVAPLVQNLVLWLVVLVWTTAVGGTGVRLTLSSAFWTFAAGMLIASYLISATLGVVAHVICVKLGLWRFWHYVLAGLLGGLIPAALWGLTVPSRWALARVAAMGLYTVPSALVVAVVVWLMVFWRNPPQRNTVDLNAFT